MDLSEASLGRALLATTAALFLVLATWINSYPFLDAETLYNSYIPDPKWVLLACAAWGLCFIGGLMSFTLYHIYPYL